MQKIKIKFVDDGRSGPYFAYEFEISNGIVTINFEIHEEDNFREFGEKLKGFPLVRFQTRKILVRSICMEQRVVTIYIDFLLMYRFGRQMNTRL